MSLETIAREWGVDVAAPSPIVLHERGRLDLARLFCTLGYTSGAEIGVERGLYSEQLCLANPALQLRAVDAWQAHRGYRDHTSQSKLEAFYGEARNRLAPYRAEIVRRFSLDAAVYARDSSLDFVYIDANHDLPHVIADIAAWEPKVRSGGIVAGHDFVTLRWTHNKANIENVLNKVPYTNCQVVAAVNAWTSAYAISPWFVLRGDVDGPDKTWGPSSWMWVKP